MNRSIVSTIVLGVSVALCAVSAQEKRPEASEGWVQLPAEGEMGAQAFAVVRNPTMYDVYVVSASSEVAGKVELRDGADGAAARELTVPAYGKLTMKADGAHVMLLDLERALVADESIRLILTTDGGDKLRIDAKVRKE